MWVRSKILACTNHSLSPPKLQLKAWRGNVAIGKVNRPEKDCRNCNYCPSSDDGDNDVDEGDDDNDDNDNEYMMMTMGAATM